MTTATTPALTELTGTYTLDPAHSRIGFVARHAMVTKVRGAFNEFEGTATLGGANPAASRAQVTISAASIDTRNAQRDEHLRRKDDGITLNAARETGGVLVSDKVTLEFEISAVKNALAASDASGKDDAAG